MYHFASETKKRQEEAKVAGDWPGEERRLLPDAQSLAVTIATIAKDLQQLQELKRGMDSLSEAVKHLAVIEERLGSQKRSADDLKNMLQMEIEEIRKGLARLRDYYDTLQDRQIEMDKALSANNRSTDASSDWMKILGAAVLSAAFTYAVTQVVSAS